MVRAEEILKWGENGIERKDLGNCTSEISVFLWAGDVPFRASQNNQGRLYIK